ncbi:MAG: hypothetical protein ACK5MN_03625 [Lachnospiraceae bacterium]
MKKITVILMTLLLAVTISLPAFATEIDQNSTPPSGSAIARAVVNPSYIITIPEDIEIAFRDTGEYELALRASNLVLAEDYQVAVAVRGSGANGAFKLIHEVNSNVMIDYKLNGGRTEVDDILAVFTANGSKGFTLTVDDWSQATKAGDYSGILTFTVSYEAVK